MPETNTIIFEKESFDIVGACYDVYKELGNGFLESVYQECLIYEFNKRNIPFVSQPKIDLKYKELLISKSFQPDFICYNAIIVEIKALVKISDEHKSQVLNYLKATGFKLGLLINFGHYPGIEQARILN